MAQLLNDFQQQFPDIWAAYTQLTKEYKSKRTLSGDIAQFFLAEESADQGRYFL